MNRVRLHCLIILNYLMPFVSDKIELKPEHFNSAGNNPYDGAASLSNIRDTCYGNQVKNQKGNLSGNF